MPPYVVRSPGPLTVVYCLLLTSCPMRVLVGENDEVCEDGKFMINIKVPRNSSFSTYYSQLF